LKISKSDFCALNIDNKFNQNIFYLHHLTTKHFCPAIARRDFCGQASVGSCASCASYIREAFALRGKLNPKKLTGLIIWRLRDQAARMVEDFSESEKVEDSAEGTNAFENLLEVINEEPSETS